MTDRYKTVWEAIGIMGAELKFKPEEVRVLIVDDQDNMRKAMRRLVQSMGIKNVVEAHDGENAISECELHPFDLIICDLYMRKISGFEVLKYLRSRQIANEIPFVVVTGEGSREDIVKTADMGADAYILKPFKIQEFEEKIVAVLNAYFSPSNIVKAIRTSENYMLEKKFTDAIKLLDQILQKDKKSARGKHNMAICLIYTDQFEQAEKLLIENIQDSPTFYRNYATLANIKLRAKNYEEACKYMSKELELHPKQPKRQNQLAMLLLKTGDYEAAKEHLREALKENSKYKPALLSMGRVFAESDDLDKALYYFKRVRRYHPTETTALNFAIKYCLDQGQNQKAEYFLRDEIGRYKDRMDARVALAKLYIGDDRESDAEEILRFVMQQDDKYTEALKVLGALLMKQKKYPEAELILTQLLTLDPKDFDALLYLSECYQNQGKNKSCLSSIHQALKIRSNHSKLLLVFGVSLMRSKQFHKAYFVLAKAALLNKESKQLHTLTKECYQLIQRKRITIKQHHNQSKAIAS